MDAIGKDAKDKGNKEVQYNGGEQMSDEFEFCEIKKIENVNIDKYDEVSRILSALGNRTRIAILQIMTKYHEVCACELQPALGMSQPTVTTHLRKMYDIGLLKQKERWKFSYYSIDPKYRTFVSDILRNVSNNLETAPYSPLEKERKGDNNGE
jgi:ArsR family transcriptional regulator